MCSTAGVDGFCEMDGARNHEISCGKSVEALIGRDVTPNKRMFAGDTVEGFDKSRKSRTANFERRGAHCPKRRTM